MSPDRVLASASPLYTGSDADGGTAVIACVKSTPGLQPAIVPSSVAKRKRLGPLLPLALTTNPSPPLKAIPSGDPPPRGLVGLGIETTSGVPGGDSTPFWS